MARILHGELTYASVLAASDTVTMTEMAAAFARAIGRNVIYKIIPTLQLAEENPGYGRELADM